MAEQVVTFEYSIDEKVTVVETGRDAWVKSLFLGDDNRFQYYVATTKATGEPLNAWLRSSELTPFVE